MKVIFASLENILANVGEKARGDLHLRLQHILNVIHFKAKGCPLPRKDTHLFLQEKWGKSDAVATLASEIQYLVVRQ